MNRGSFWKLQISDLPRRHEKALVKDLVHLGALGTSEVLSFVQPDLVYDPQVRRKPRLCLDAYFASRPSKFSLHEVLQKYSATQSVFSEEPNQDWMQEWKKNFHAFELVDGIWVVPSWEASPSQAHAVIRLDPGMAFGTGTHETTQLAAQLIVQLVREKQIPQSVLDVGTGTGILAMLCHLLNIPKIEANDIDPEACRTAQENFAQNDCNRSHLVSSNLVQLDQSYDLVVANIIDGVLVHLRDSLISRLGPSGSLILSGILLEREAEFLRGFLKSTWEIDQRITRNEWVAFRMSRK